MKITECTLCKLYKNRIQVVPSMGPIPCNVMVIGEAPGKEESIQGEPFVGRSGKLLMEWFESINLIRNKNYFLTNILHCRPPGNRDPLPKEIKICTEAWLKPQIQKVNPKLIITVGRIASQYILKMDTPMRRLHGRIFQRAHRKIIPIYHPSYVLRQKEDVPEVIEDLKLIKKELL